MTKRNILHLIILFLLLALPLSACGKRQRYLDAPETTLEKDKIYPRGYPKEAPPPPIK